MIFDLVNPSAAYWCKSTSFQVQVGTRALSSISMALFHLQPQYMILA